MKGLDGRRRLSRASTKTNPKRRVTAAHSHCLSKGRSTVRGRRGSLLRRWARLDSDPPCHPSLLPCTSSTSCTSLPLCLYRSKHGSAPLHLTSLPLSSEGSVSVVSSCPPFRLLSSSLLRLLVVLYRRLPAEPEGRTVNDWWSERWCRAEGHMSSTFSSSLLLIPVGALHIMGLCPKSRIDALFLVSSILSASATFSSSSELASLSASHLPLRVRPPKPLAHDRVKVLPFSTRDRRLCRKWGRGTLRPTSSSYFYSSMTSNPSCWQLCHVLCSSPRPSSSTSSNVSGLRTNSSPPSSIMRLISRSRIP